MSQRSQIVVAATLLLLSAGYANAAAPSASNVDALPQRTESTPPIGLAYRPGASGPAAKSAALSACDTNAGVCAAGVLRTVATAAESGFVAGFSAAAFRDASLWLIATPHIASGSADALSPKESL